MRYIVLVFCFGVLVTLTACNKKIAVSQNVDPANLVGTWELRETQAGMIPNTQHPPGNGNRFRFTGTTYERYTNGSLVKSGSYSIVQDSTVEKEVGLVVPPGQFTRRIVFENNLSADKTFFELSSGRLVLLSGYFPTDGGSRQAYEKVEESR